jgi:hypothetical protein
MKEVIKDEKWDKINNRCFLYESVNYLINRTEIPVMTYPNFDCYKEDYRHSDCFYCGERGNGDTEYDNEAFDKICKDNNIFSNPIESDEFIEISEYFLNTHLQGIIKNRRTLPY